MKALILYCVILCVSHNCFVKSMNMGLDYCFTYSNTTSYNKYFQIYYCENCKYDQSKNGYYEVYFKNQRANVFFKFDHINYYIASARCLSKDLSDFKELSLYSAYSRHFQISFNETQQGEWDCVFLFHSKNYDCYVDNRKYYKRIDWNFRIINKATKKLEQTTGIPTFTSSTWTKTTTYAPNLMNTSSIINKCEDGKLNLALVYGMTGGVLAIMILIIIMSLVIFKTKKRSGKIKNETSNESQGQTPSFPEYVNLENTSLVPVEKEISKDFKNPEFEIYQNTSVTQAYKTSEQNPGHLKFDKTNLNYKVLPQSKKSNEETNLNYAKLDFNLDNTYVNVADISAGIRGDKDREPYSTVFTNTYSHSNGATGDHEYANIYKLGMLRK